MITEKDIKKIIDTSVEETMKYMVEQQKESINFLVDELKKKAESYSKAIDLLEELQNIFPIETSAEEMFMNKVDAFLKER